jgi:hypothetical protein
LTFIKYWVEIVNKIFDWKSIVEASDNYGTVKSLQTEKKFKHFSDDFEEDKIQRSKENDCYGEIL